MTIFLIALAISLAINIILFIPAFIFKTDKLTDASYSLSFICVALSLFLIGDFSLLKLVALMCILIWSLRLGIFLLVRISKMKRDKRFDGIRENFFKFLRFWVSQAVSVTVILLPIIFLFASKIDTKFNWLSLLGLIIFVKGLIIEATADIQKYRFNQDFNNKNAWIDEGLWRISRHPNYLGEITVWLGVYVLCLPGLTPTQRVVSLISPIFIASLLIFISGLPPLEKSANKKWANNSKYQQYKKQVPVLVPSIGSIKRLFKK